MLQYMHLVFDGKDCTDFGIICANGTTSGSNSSSGPYNEIFVADRTINEDTIPDRPVPYFKSVTATPITTPPLILAWAKGFNQKGLQLVKQWLNKKTYSEFYFREYAIRHYFGIMATNNTITHNGMDGAFATINIRCNAPYAYSPQMRKFLQIPSSGKYVRIDNKGDDICYPYIQFTKDGDGDISILNKRDGGRQFVLTGLKDGETITIDNDNEDVQTDLPNTYRFDNHNGVFVHLPVGRNILFIHGACHMAFYYRFILF